MNDQTSNEDEYSAKVSKQLHETMDDYDDQVKDKLAQMRQIALDHIPDQAVAKRRKTARYLAFAGAASLLVIFFIAWPQFNLHNAGDEFPQFAELNKLEILTQGENLEMLENDIEFYLWLEEELANSAG